MSGKSSPLRPAALGAAVAFALTGFAQSPLAATASASADSYIKTPLELSGALRLTPLPDSSEGPTVLSAHRIEGSPDSLIIMTGEAEIRRQGEFVRGDKLTYDQTTGTVSADGNAEVFRSGMTFTAPAIVYRLDEKTGNAHDVEYEYAPRKLRGSAKQADFAVNASTVLTDVCVTTCRKDNMGWWVELDKLTIDEYEEQAVGHGAVLKLGGIPVFGSPWFSFPISQKRKSGVLTPTFGMSTTRGVDFSVPIYFNLAPNYDYTLTPRIMSKRGLLLENEARWKTPWFETAINVDYINRDRLTHNDRFGLHAQLQGAVNDFMYGVNYNRVSDDDFTTDFSNDITGSADEVLPQDYWLSYAQRYWNASLRVTQNQTLDINGDHYEKPYERVPQITWNGYVGDFHGFELTTMLDATRFKHPAFDPVLQKHYVNGDRFVVNQKIAYPITAPGWFITPKAEFLGTWYSLNSSLGGTYLDTSPFRVLPIVSLDSGLVFERDTSIFSHSMTQTLEPRLFYTYIPYRNQDNLPVFDSDLAELSYAQLFTENAFSGYDRVSEANQLSAMLTSRFIDQKSGLERFRVGIGQRFYFSDQRVGLPRYTGNSTELIGQRDSSKSDVLASVGARLTKGLQSAATIQYSSSTHKISRADAGITWRPRPLSAMNLYYRYIWDAPNSPDNLKQIDFSTQWPLSQRWYVLLRQNYSLEDKKFVENLAGLEYQADCWTLRMVAQRYTTSSNQTETNYYLQLELTGLGAVGSSPLSALRKSIRGYQTYSPAPSSIGTYDYYR